MALRNALLCKCTHYNVAMNRKFSAAHQALVKRRHQTLLTHIQQLPPPGSRPLTLDGRVAGWIVASATRAIAGLPGVRIDDEAVHVSAGARQEGSLTRRLARVAQTLRDAGCLRSWRDELLDVIAEGQCLAVMERAAMRPLGLLTRAVRLNGWSADGRLWIARRADDKPTDPGMWDNLVGGLASAGESLDQSLLRESSEEAGLAAVDLCNRTPLRTVLRMHRRLPEGYQVEDVFLSDCVLEDAVTPCNQDGEVAEIRLVSCRQAWQMIEEGLFTYEAELSILDSLRRGGPWAHIRRA